MKIPCYRCGKEIDTPNAFNADYILALDTMVKETVDVIIAVKHNQATLAKKAKMREVDIVLAEDGITELAKPRYPDLVIEDSEYDEVEVPSIVASRDIGEDLVKIISGTKEKDIQKTGIICPDCYKPSDTVIWGVHKVK